MKKLILLLITATMVSCGVKRDIAGKVKFQEGGTYTAPETITIVAPNGAVEMLRDSVSQNMFYNLGQKHKDCKWTVQRLDGELHYYVNCLTVPKKKDPFKFKEFNNSQAHASHGEPGHVCDATCH